MFDRGSPWDGQHNGGSPQEPGQRYLRGARTVCLRDSVEHLAGNFARSQWEPGNKSNSIALTISHHVIPITPAASTTLARSRASAVASAAATTVLIIVPHPAGGSAQDTTSGMWRCALLIH